MKSQENDRLPQTYIIAPNWAIATEYTRQQGWKPHGPGVHLVYNVDRIRGRTFHPQDTIVRVTVEGRDEPLASGLESYLELARMSSERLHGDDVPEEQVVCFP